MADKNCTTYSIYRIVCFQTGKCYVGQTANLKLRRTQHFSDLKCGAHSSIKLQRAYEKYGRGAFFFEVVESDVLADVVDAREMHWVAHFDSCYNGYNMTPGGDTAVPDSGKSCEWNGITYASISAAARALGLSVHAMQYRVERGYTSDADRQRDHETACTWNGVQYPNIASAAIANGISGFAMGNYLRKGYTCDADIEDTRGKPCMWNGIEYVSVSEAARANGLSASAMALRIRKGYKSDAEVSDKCRKPFTWNGVTYVSIIEAATANGVHRTTMQFRRRRGYTCDADLDQH